MSYQRKTSKGEPFSSAIEAVEWILAGYHVYDNNKPQSPSWMHGRYFGALICEVERGTIVKCMTADGKRPYKSMERW